jgi:hypothetical protein
MSQHDDESSHSQSTVSPKRGRGRPRRWTREKLFSPLRDYSLFVRLRDYYVISFHQHCYIAVGAVIVEKLLATGTRIPIIQACRLLVKRGGLVLIGRDPYKSQISASRLYEFRDVRRKPHFHRSDSGRMFVQRRVRAAKSIETRYHEAKRFAESDPNVKFAWDNMVCDRLGLPRLPTERPRLSTVVPGALVRSYC